MNQVFVDWWLTLAFTIGLIALAYGAIRFAGWAMRTKHRFVADEPEMFAALSLIWAGLLIGMCFEPIGWLVRYVDFAISL